jgi:methionyl-tRNA formyltransferase
VAVYSQPPRKKGRGMHMQESPVQMIAKTNLIKTFTPTDFFSKISKKEIEELYPDLIIVSGTRIVKNKMLIFFLVVRPKYFSDSLAE